MSQQRYYKLIDDLWANFGDGDSTPPPLYEYCNLEINGIAFTLMHGAEANSDELVIYADFGEVPLDRKEAVYQCLLNAVYVMQGPFAPSYSFNAENGHIVQMARMPATHWSAPLLIATMANMATIAERWKVDFFLTDTEPGIALPELESASQGESHVL